MQDFTGVPAVVDLAAMRDATAKLGADPQKINPLVPVDLVIDHSVMVDSFGTPLSFRQNVELEYERNGERYEFLRWGQKAFDNFRVVPPGTGICHQVNLEYLAQTVWTREDEDGEIVAYPDTLVGTDSHTTMVNGLAVLGWGVGGIEAEAAMLGQPITMLIPEVIGFKMTGKINEGITATDLVLTVTEMLRKKGVVGKFVEFYGPGLDYLSLEDQATIANMAPEYGATCGFFPVDRDTLDYLRTSGRDADARGAGRGLFRGAGHVPRRQLARSGLHRHARARPHHRRAVALRPQAPAGPRRRSPMPRRSSQALKDRRRPQGPHQAPESGARAATSTKARPASTTFPRSAALRGEGRRLRLDDGDVVIAAITSCTNTSNPSVLIAAGLVARKARAQGLTVEALGQDLAGARLAGGHRLSHRRRASRTISTRSASTSSAMAAPPASAIPARCRRRSPKAISDNDLVAASVLSGNRNFEGRVNPDVRANYPRLAAAGRRLRLAGSMNVDLTTEPLGTGKDGKPVYLQRHLADQPGDRRDRPHARHARRCSSSRYSDVFKGDEHWQGIAVEGGETYGWNSGSTYVQNPPYFEGLTMEPDAGHRHRGCAHPRALPRLDHHRPHLAGRLVQGRHAGRQVPRRAAGRAHATSTPTARAAATTK